MFIYGIDICYTKKTHTNWYNNDNNCNFYGKPMFDSLNTKK